VKLISLQATLIARLPRHLRQSVTLTIASAEKVARLAKGVPTSRLRAEKPLGKS